MEASPSAAGGFGGSWVPGATFANRRSAGAALARAVERLRFPKGSEVYALPRGGIPVGFEVARALHVPLRVMVVRKIGMPAQPERAIGAIGPRSVIVRERGLTGRLRLAGISFEELVQAERDELTRREWAYSHGESLQDLTGRTVLLIDDGLATGTTMIAAIRAARKAGAATVAALAPVASDEAAALVGGEADETLFLKVPAYLGSIGEWYDEFPQLTDAEVCRLLDEAAAEASATSNPSQAPERSA